MPESSGDFQPIPAGNYTATIGGAEVKTTKDGSGQYIALRLDITGPSHEGRVVFTNLNIRNRNPKAEEIARQQLGDIMRACGLSTVTDTDQLIGHTLQIKVSVKPATDEYAAGNEVKGFKAVAGGIPPKAASAQAAPTGGATPPPWASK
jgi:hypothetical protein